MRLYEILEARSNVPVDDAFAVLFAGKHKTSEISGVPPVSFTSKGGVLEDYLITGNTVQNGTPTPETPVDVVGCGERTGNLFDKNAKNVNNGYISEYYIYYDNTPVKPSSSLVWNTSEYIEITSGNIVLSTLLTTGSGYPAICFYDSSKNYIIGYSYDNGEVRIHTVPSGAKYCRISIDERVINQLMLNSGSAALPYEPYGYKLSPIVNGTEYPIYLGQVPTTRRIKKLVLTGEEDWTLWNGGYYSNVIDRKGATTTIVCSHFINSRSGGISYNLNSSYGLKIAADVIPFVTSVEELKAWLANQYSAGTPVTFWYILATPETGIVNEPLHKIGDYADTISMAQASVTIPTTAGTNTLLVDTTVQPSSVTIRGRIRPTL